MVTIVPGRIIMAAIMIMYSIVDCGYICSTVYMWVLLRLYVSAMKAPPVSFNSSSLFQTIPSLLQNGELHT